MTARSSIEPGAAGARPRTSTMALVAVFTALAAALGYALAWLPNIELITFTVFASGVALGRWRGALVGALAMALYSGLNPYGSGAAVPPLYAAQIVGLSVAGLAGGGVRRLWLRERPVGPVAGAAAGAALGLSVTAVYQALVVGSLALTMPDPGRGFLAALAAGGLFSALHLVSNAVAFAVLAPAVLPRLRGAAGPSLP